MTPARWRSGLRRRPLVGHSAIVLVASTSAFLWWNGRVDGQVFFSGVVCALIATLGAAFIASHEDRVFAWRTASIAPFVKAIAGIPRGVARSMVFFVHVLLGRRRQGAFHDAPLEKGDASNRGRRAMVVLADSLAPDSYVTRVDAGHHVVRLHGIGPARR